jgi:hypothetical protein
MRRRHYGDGTSPILFDGSSRRHPLRVLPRQSLTTDTLCLVPTAESLWITIDSPRFCSQRYLPPTRHEGNLNKGRIGSSAFLAERIVLDSNSSRSVSPVALAQTLALCCKLRGAFFKYTVLPFNAWFRSPGLATATRDCGYTLVCPSHPAAPMIDVGVVETRMLCS